jgi:hypothetical protein
VISFLGVNVGDLRHSDVQITRMFYHPQFYLKNYIYDFLQESPTDQALRLASAGLLVNATPRDTKPLLMRLLSRTLDWSKEWNVTSCDLYGDFRH